MQTYITVLGDVVQYRQAETAAPPPPPPPPTGTGNTRHRRFGIVGSLPSLSQVFDSDGAVTGSPPPPPPPPPPPSGTMAPRRWALVGGLPNPGTVFYSEGVVSAAPPPPTPPVPSITLELVGPGRSAQRGLTGLKWAFFDSADFPALLATPPVHTGLAETTDGQGVITIEVPDTTLSSGGTGWLIISNSDGTATQDPPSMAFCAPVVID